LALVVKDNVAQAKLLCAGGLGGLRLHVFTHPQEEEKGYEAQLADGLHLWLGDDHKFWNIQFGMLVGTASCGWDGGSSHLNASICHLMWMW